MNKNEFKITKLIFFLSLHNGSSLFSFNLTKTFFYCLLLFLTASLPFTKSHAQQVNSQLVNNQQAKDDALFLAIGQCNVNGVEQALANGANVEANYTGQLNQQLNIILEGEYSPLAFAVLGFQCWHHLNQEANVDDKLNYLISKTNEIIEILLTQGADPHLLIKNHLSRVKRDIPVIRLAFHTDIAAAIAVPFFEKMVELGANPNAEDSEGHNVLFDVNIAHLPVDDVLKLLDLGADFNLITSSGYNATGVFPPYYRNNADLQRILAITTNNPIDFTKGDYSEHYISHPLAREIDYSFSGYFAADNKQERRQIIEEELAPLAQPILNVNTGKEQQHLLTHLMKHICPTTQFQDHVYFPFNTSFNRDVDEQQKLAQSYRWFIKLIKTLGFDLTHKDPSGIELITYAMHYCPFEVVDAMYQQTNKFPSQDQFALMASLNGGKNKQYGDTMYFNNDHRTVNFILDSGVPSNLIKDYLVELTNPKIASLVELLGNQWQLLSEVGLNYHTTTNIPAQVSYRYDKYTDIKEESFSLSNSQGKKTINFTGQPLAVNLGQGPNPIRFRGIGNFFRGPVSGFEYWVNDGRIHYRFFGSFSYTGDTLLSEISPNNDVRVFVKQTKSNATQPLTIRKREIIQVNRTTPYLLDDPNDLRYSHLNAFKYYGPEDKVSCSALLCNYFTIEKNSPSVSRLSINENALNTDFPHIYLLWDYLNTPMEDRKAKRNQFRAQDNKDLSAFLLDMVQLSFSEKRQEEEALDLLDMLISPTLSNQLDFPVELLSDKLTAITPLTDAGKHFINIRTFLLTGNQQQSAYLSASSSFFSLQEFLVLSESVEMKAPYLQRYQTIKTAIANNLAEITTKLNLTNEQVSDLQLVLQ
jgi:hypothetical protein